MNHIKKVCKSVWIRVCKCACLKLEVVRWVADGSHVELVACGTIYNKYFDSLGMQLL